MPVSKTKTEQRLPARQEYRHIVMVAVGLVFFGSGIASALDQDTRNLTIAAILVGLVFVPVTAERWVGLVVPLNLEFQYALLLLAGPYLGGYWRWYLAWQPWDTLVHLYSGVFVSFVLIFILGKVLGTYRLILPTWFEMFSIIAISALIALTWEIGEFVFDFTFGTSTQTSNADTMIDMIAGLVPSLGIVWVLYAYRRRGTFTYIGSLLEAGQARL